MEFLKDVKDQDLYKLFEIERGADTSEIKKAQCENLKKILPLQFSVKLISVDKKSQKPQF